MRGRSTKGKNWTVRVPVEGKKAWASEAGLLASSLMWSREGKRMIRHTNERRGLIYHSQMLTLSLKTVVKCCLKILCTADLTEFEEIHVQTRRSGDIKGNIIWEGRRRSMKAGVGV